MTATASRARQGDQPVTLARFRLPLEGAALDLPQPGEEAPPPEPAAAAPRRRRTWPLAAIAAPAAVAIWSGWVGLGAMCGFGLVQPLPGIVSWHLDTAITLPVGIESYGAYALYTWLGESGSSGRARRFARGSALGAAALGCLGQVAFHLMAAAGWHRAPWYVVMLVACLPVITLFFAATLTHLIRAPETAPEVTASPAAQITLTAPAGVTPEPDSSHPQEADAGHPAEPGSSQPEPATQVTRRAPSRRRTQVTRQGISDDDLKAELRSALKSDPDITVAAAAKKLKRGRDRIRPLLEEVRREASGTPSAGR